MSNTEPVLYIHDAVRLANLSDSRAPILMSNELDIPDQAITNYLKPAEHFKYGARSYILERDRLSQSSSLLGRIMCQAQEIDAPDFTPDRDLLIESISRDGTTKDELLVAFGIYTTLVRMTAQTIGTAETAPNVVVHTGVRRDLIQLFSAAERIFETLEEDAQEQFMHELTINFSPKFQDPESIVHPTYAKEQWNGSIYMIRNATLDIVTNCDSSLDPATIMATRLIRNFIVHPEIRTDNSLIEMLNSYVKDPDVLIRNPELLFALDTLWSSSYSKKQDHLRRKEVERTADGIVLSMFKRLRENDQVDDYSKKLASVYFAVADRSIDQLERRNTFSKKPSDGGYHNVAIALTTLATTVANANGEDQTFTVRDYAKAFDYILPLIDTNALWPELETETVKTFEKAFSKIIHLTDQ